MTNIKYSVIYGHFEKVYCKVGQILSKGDKIGYMGTTGNSTGIHTHISVVEGEKTWCWSLASMAPGGTNIPSEKQCLKLLNPYILNGINPKIECGWLCYKNHYGYDFIGSREVCWSLDVKATVTAIGNLPSKVNGWGNFVVVTYNYDEPKPTPEPVIQKFKIGDDVIINGDLYKSSDAPNPSGKISNKQTKITRYVRGAKHPYNTTGDLGWMDEKDIRGLNEDRNEISINDKVKIIGSYASSSTDTKALYDAKKGSACYIGKIYEGRNYPYQLVTKQNTVASKYTIGFASKNAIEKI